MTGKEQTTPAPSAEEVRQHLKKVLESPVFRGSKRCQRFLAYVAEAQLRGETDSLKERTIAVDVFDRPPHSDLNEDSIVRVGAREVRKRLAQYYVSPESEEDKIHIELPPGSYVPEFRHVHSRTVMTSGDEDDTREIVPPLAARASWSLWKALCAVLFLVIVALVVWILRLQYEPGSSVVEKFWRPALDAKEPLLIALPNPVIYRPTRRALNLSEDVEPTGKTQPQQVLRVPFERLNGTDFQLIQDQFVGFGDAVVTSAVSGFLRAHAGSSRVRLAGQVAFTDMRETPVLLVGAFTNRWAMELTKNLRFRPEWERQDNAHIAETAPPYRSWRLEGRTQDDWTDEDYILVCRMPRSPTGGPLFITAGVTQSGTEAAATVLFSPKHLDPIIAKLPKDWASHNLELLLHTRIIGHTANPPEVVAWHIW